MAAEIQHPVVFKHMAVRLQECILVFGGTDMLHKDRSRVIYVYNIFIDQWRKYKAYIPKGNTDFKATLTGCCAITVSSDIYVIGEIIENTASLNLWKLRRNRNGSFSWSEVRADQAPSCRSYMTGWEYGKKLWCFGGYGANLASVGHLNEFGDFDGRHNNQLLGFDPSSINWSNLQCSGTVPSPRSRHASAMLDDKVWLYGGVPGSTMHYLHDLYVLSMPNLTWTQIQTKGLMPALEQMSLNAITDTKLAFYGIENLENKEAKCVTCILDVSDMSCREFKFTASFTNHMYRFYQTGTSGLYGSVIIIGGYNGLQVKEPFWIRAEPKCLQQLAMKTIYKHQETLAWKHLPRKLICKMLGTT